MIYTYFFNSKANNKGVRPNINKFKTNRECNPIEPTYRLPTYTPAEPP